MAEILISLENNLKSQIHSYRKLIQLEKEKQQALVNNKIQEIEIITVQEEKILLEVGRLEEGRLYWAEFFAKKIGKQIEEITMADLAINFPIFDSVKQELEDIIAELNNLHQTNTKLLENAINLVNITISSLTSVPKTTYAKTTVKENNKTNSNVFFINKNV